MDEPMKHSNACRALLDSGSLAEALKYCADQRIEPPQCSLTAESPNADRLRALAKNVLIDYGWWVKRLKIRTKREAEIERLQQTYQRDKKDEGQIV